MSIIMNESLGKLEYDGLINSAYPADIIHASLASGYGKLSRQVFDSQSFQRKPNTLGQ